MYSVFKLSPKIKKSPIAGKPADNKKPLDRDSRRAITTSNPQSRSILVSYAGGTLVLEVAQ